MPKISDNPQPGSAAQSGTGKGNFSQSETGDEAAVICDDEVICDGVASLRQIMTPAAVASLVILALLAICYSLYFCKAIMLPITGAFLLNFLFSPIVSRLGRHGVHNALSAILILVISVVLFVVAILFAYEPATAWLENREKNMEIVEAKLLSLKKPLETIQDVSRQIDDLTSGKTAKTPGGGDGEDEQEDGKKGDEKSAGSDGEPDGKETADAARKSGSKQNGGLDSGASEGASEPDPEDGEQESGEETADQRAPAVEVVPVEVRQPSISSRIFTTTGDALIGISLMIVLLFYLLASGDRGLEKLVELMPGFRNKRRVVELTRAIEKSVSRYLLTTTVINFGLGLVIGTGMWMIGMPNPALWGVMAMLLNYFPFVGAIIGAVIVFLVAVVSFDSVAYATAAPGIYLGTNLIEANFITPVMLGRSISLHPVWLMIFFVIVSWVWGLGGAIVAVPVLAVIKISCDHIEPLMPVGKFLGR